MENGHDKTILVGCGAGFANDRPDAALRLAQDLAQRSGQRYIMLELLAERTLAEAQLRKRLDPQAGYSSRLFDFLEPMLALCIEAGIPIITTAAQLIPGPPRNGCVMSWRVASLR